jgi:restriction endonuclease Mrr
LKIAGVPLDIETNPSRMEALPFNTGHLLGDHMQIMGYAGKGAAHGKKVRYRGDMVIDGELRML